jgi:hypothetical protein
MYEIEMEGLLWAERASALFTVVDVTVAASCCDRVAAD